MRLYFHLRECGTDTPDGEGKDIVDLAAAHAEAIAAARAVMSAEILEGNLCLGCRIDVVDDSGETLLVVPFREAVKVVEGGAA